MRGGIVNGSILWMRNVRGQTCWSFQEVCSNHSLQTAASRKTSQNARMSYSSRFHSSGTGTSGWTLGIEQLRFHSNCVQIKLHRMDEAVVRHDLKKCCDVLQISTQMLHKFQEESWGKCKTLSSHWLKVLKKTRSEDQVPEKVSWNAHSLLVPQKSQHILTSSTSYPLEQVCVWWRLLDDQMSRCACENI